MTTKRTVGKWYIRLNALLCVCSMLLLFLPRINVGAYDVEEENTIHTATLSNVIISENENNQLVVQGVLSGVPFCIEGQMYNVYDGIDNNKIYFVETNRENDSQKEIYILNLEFESNAKSRNLNVENQALCNSDVIRVAAYMGGQYHYAEQGYSLEDEWLDNVIPISRGSKSPQMETIASNASWFIHATQATGQTIENGIQIEPRGVVLPVPIPEIELGESLDQIDIDVVTQIGKLNFRRIREHNDTTLTGGYFIKGVEWPQGSGNIHTSCLYYGIVRNTPEANTTEAQLQVKLIADRQYLYIAEENTIEAYMPESDFRMYDLKLAVACTQYTAGNGYDYIYEQTTTLSRGGNTNAPFSVARAIIMQFDKYGILSIADAIFSAFSANDQIDGSKHNIWPSDYLEHYAYFDSGKEANTMLRAVRVDTDGYCLNEEGAYLLMEVGVADRDYEDSATNVSIQKGMNYAISYNLRSKNAYYLWVNGGDDAGDITHEFTKYYTK